ncbi:heme-binding protein [Phyllobacterium ifriqiyense]|uniref:heme-binding protein n=1 Tax=Phyllobacterium ifriqiyense TaxID=314238 RepID=UPI00339AD53A
MQEKDRERLAAIYRQSPSAVQPSWAWPASIHAGGLLLTGGGLPLLGCDGVLIGANGASGGSPQQDVAIARAASA